jgi:ribosomal protection tetracycline resistance protein
MTQYIRHTLREGLSGWQVTDCVVTMTDCGYSSPGTTAADFRKLTPVVLMAALQQAGTQVCEPIDSFRLEFPADCMPALLAALPRLRAVPQVPQIRGSSCVVDGEIPAGQVHALQQQLPPLARGEGTLESQFARYQPGEWPATDQAAHRCQPAESQRVPAACAARHRGRGLSRPGCWH